LRNSREFGFKYHIYMCNIHLGIMFLSRCGFGKEVHRFFVLHIVLFLALYVQVCKSYISFNSTLCNIAALLYHEPVTVRSSPFQSS